MLNVVQICSIVLLLEAVFRPHILFLFSPPPRPPFWVMVRDSGADDEDVDVGITVEASDVNVVVVAAEVSITLLIGVH